MPQKLNKCRSLHVARARENGDNSKMRRGAHSNPRSLDGHHPTEANIGARYGTSANSPGQDEVDTAIIHGRKAARPAAVVVCGMVWQARRQIDLFRWRCPCCRPVEHGENLEPPLDARVVASHFADAVDRLMIRNNAKRRSRNEASKTFCRQGQCSQLRSRAGSSASRYRSG